jgi:hypothetical protein
MAELSAAGVANDGICECINSCEATDGRVISEGMHRTNQDARLLPSTSDERSDASESDLLAANLRDIADLVPKVLQSGRLYRSSQFHTPEVREALGIVTVMDLRRSGKRCKHPARVAQEFLWPDWMFLHAKGTLGDTVAPRCPNCEATLKCQPRAVGRNAEHKDAKVSSRPEGSF